MGEEAERAEEEKMEQQLVALIAEKKNTADNHQHYHQENQNDYSYE